MDIQQAALRQRIDIGAEGFHHRAVERGFAGHRRRRRQADADTPRAPNADDRVDDLEWEAQTVLDRPAIAVGSLVGAVADELFEQIVVRRMDFDPIEPSRLGVGGGAAIILDDSGDLVRFERARRDVVLHPVLGERLSDRLDGRRRHRRLSALQVRVRDAARMPQLQKHDAAPIMDSLHDRAPCLDLLVVPDARRQRIADRLGGDVGRLAYDDPRVSALRVIVGGEVRRDPVVVRTAARQRRHNDAVA